MLCLICLYALTRILDVAFPRVMVVLMLMMTVVVAMLLLMMALLVLLVIPLRLRCAMWFPDRCLSELNQTAASVT